MKKFSVVAISFIFCSLLLISCESVKTYDDGYADGYKEGYSDARIKFEDEYSLGLIDGSDDAEEHMGYLLHKAYDYARDNTELSVYEAWNNIMAYHDLSCTDPDTIPSEEEYKESAKTLAYFCEYLERLLWL